MWDDQSGGPLSPQLAPAMFARSTDGGQSWELLEGGLPVPAWVAVLRESSSFDDGGVYFGTQSGSVFASADGGDSWVEAATHLPPILSVEAADWQ